MVMVMVMVMTSHGMAVGIVDDFSFID